MFSSTVRRWCAVMGALTWLAAPPAAALHEAGHPLVLGTHQPANNLQGRLVRLIYTEAFRRLDLPVRIETIPLQRLAVMSDQGEIDGDVSRVYDWGPAHPNLVRVEEPFLTVVFALFTIHATLDVQRLDDLASRSLNVVYVRGAAICENNLKSRLPAERVLALSSEPQGLGMLMAGRADLFCTTDFAIADLQSQPEYQHAPAVRQQVPINAVPLYPYLHQRHAELAPRLAAVLRQMKAEGLIERYRAETFRRPGN